MKTRHCPISLRLKIRFIPVDRLDAPIIAHDLSMNEAVNLTRATALEAKDSSDD